ncbi:MAG: MarR family transcriptional regulator [Candidatus Thiodiazotropha sp. (ex Myrtea spinifera)]|nr:MarR family transcriptional regulator [Candidatus Thiodiazotropha sp. (ex Myrtea spinifera)]MCU7830377.1 MarR family transcriptional regulator [Candidatus Thiodiazotropha sp. (ex Myrtea sp. 'scaly one' KF741663)]
MKRSKEGQMFTDIVLDIFKLSGLLVAEGDVLTKDVGLSSARWKVLGALAHSDGSMTVPQIAYSMGQSRQSVQRLTDAMEGSGILVYQDNPHHKKAKLVALSEKGKEIFELLEQKQIPWANLAADGLNASDMEIALSVLRKMIQRFET